MAQDGSESRGNPRRFQPSQGAILGLHQQAPKYIKILCFHNRTQLPAALLSPSPVPLPQADAKRLVLPPKRPPNQPYRSPQMATKQNHPSIRMNGLT